MRNLWHRGYEIFTHCQRQVVSHEIRQSDPRACVHDVTGVYFLLRMCVKAIAPGKVLGWSGKWCRSWALTLGKFGEEGGASPGLVVKGGAAERAVASV